MFELNPFNRLRVEAEEQFFIGEFLMQDRAVHRGFAACFASTLPKGALGH